MLKYDVCLFKLHAFLVPAAIVLSQRLYHKSPSFKSSIIETMPDPSLPNLVEPDNDPRVWLEDVDGEKALAWVESENARTLARFEGPELDTDRKALREALDRPGRIPKVKRIGGLLYNFWSDAEHKKGLWRRTKLESYSTDIPGWEILIDLDALVAADGTDWVWHGAELLAPTHDRALVHLSIGGSDAVTIREFDLQTRSFLPEGFYLTEAKSHVDWLDRDTLLLVSAYGGPDMVTTSGYSRTTRLWRRGESPDDAKVLTECSPQHMSVHAHLDRTAPDGERVVYSDQKSFFSRAIHFGDRNGPKTLLDVPEDTRLSFVGDYLLIRPRVTWSLEGKEYVPDTILVFRLSEYLAGKRDPAVLFTPTPLTAIQSVFLVGHYVVLSLLDNIKPACRVYHLQTTSGTITFAQSTMSGLLELGEVSISLLDDSIAESDGTLLIQMDNSITPPTTCLASVSDLALKPLKRESAAFETVGLTCTRYDATADDGLLIPYFVTGPAGAPTGDAPVYLYGYGGYHISSLPNYNIRIGVLWLSKGGIAVNAGIRGGGEFGTRWHEAGRGPLKRLAHDDFAAVARDLVRRGFTTPRRIAGEGASNGGLLISNIWNRHAKDFGALFCRVPLVDMRRYTKLSAGASWIDEYGDPASEEDWSHLGKISAYHNIVTNSPTPPAILIQTVRRDDRVHPGHARKFALKLREMGGEPLFYEPIGGGHGLGADNEQVAAVGALGTLFLRRAIGWEA